MTIGGLIQRRAGTPSKLLSSSRVFSVSARAELSKTPLWDWHVDPERGGKMVEFAGFSMPLSYEGTGANIAGGPVAEHHQVRTSAGLFDVSHMVQSKFSGPGALKFLERLLPAGLSALPETGNVHRATLSALLNREGGIIDDCMITRWGPNEFYLVTNAGRRERDLAWITEVLDEWKASGGDAVTTEVLGDNALVALQGPKAVDALKRLLPGSFAISDLTFGASAFTPLSSGSDKYHIARVGYTGEDGFEISVPPGEGNAAKLADLLCDQAEVKPTGLAARDSLRLEAGLCLYGHDLDETVGIGEAVLGWIVPKDRRTPDAFIGAERTLKELKKGGCVRKRVGLAVEKGAPAREGAKIFTEDGQTEIGIVTSGLPAPTVGKNISMGYIETKDGLNVKGTKVKVEVRKKLRSAEVVGMPWIQVGYVR